MDRQMQLYWQAFEELVSTDDILKTDLNPIYHFDDQMVEGAILDIGCGQITPLITYSDCGRRLIGIDSEKSQLKKLHSRMVEIAGADNEDWTLIAEDVQKSTLPDGPYAMVIMYNILHFFSMKECAEIIAKIDERLVKGSLITLCVHSTKHPANDSANPDSMAYFKHFFTQEDVDSLFPANQFDRLYFADVIRNYDKKDAKVSALWAERIIADFKITNNRKKAAFRKHATSQQSTAELLTVYRKQ